MTYESLSHSRWDCKYHLVFVPKYRKKTLYGKIRGYLGPVFPELARQRGSKILEGHMVQDHVHMLISILLKYAVSTVEFEEEEIRKYIKNQKQLDTEGSEETGEF